MNFEVFIGWKNNEFVVTPVPPPNSDEYISDNFAKMCKYLRLYLYFLRDDVVSVNNIIRKVYYRLFRSQFNKKINSINATVDQIVSGWIKETDIKLINMVKIHYGLKSYSYDNETKINHTLDPFKFNVRVIIKLIPQNDDTVKSKDISLMSKSSSVLNDKILKSSTSALGN